MTSEIHIRRFVKSLTSAQQQIFEHNEAILSFVVSTLNKTGVLLPYAFSVNALSSTLNDG